MSSVGIVMKDDSVLGCVLWPPDCGKVGAQNLLKTLSVSLEVPCRQQPRFRPFNGAEPRARKQLRGSFSVFGLGW